MWGQRAASLREKKPIPAVGNARFASWGEGERSRVSPGRRTPDGQSELLSVKSSPRRSKEESIRGREFNNSELFIGILPKVSTKKVPLSRDLANKAPTMRASNGVARPNPMPPPSAARYPLVTPTPSPREPTEELSVPPPRTMRAERGCGGCAPPPPAPPLQPRLRASPARDLAWSRRLIKLIRAQRGAGGRRSAVAAVPRGGRAGGGEGRGPFRAPRGGNSPGTRGRRCKV